MIGQQAHRDWGFDSHFRKRLSLEFSTSACYFGILRPTSVAEIFAHRTRVTPDIREEVKRVYSGI